MREGLITAVAGSLVFALSLVFGSVLADPVIDAITTALTNASIGSFSGATSIGGLVPLIYFTGVIVTALGGLGGGIYGGVRALRGRR